MPLEEKINPNHTALLVVDVQVDFCSPEGVFGVGRDYSLVNKVMSKLPNFIKLAEKKGILTLYTKQVYDRKKLNKLQLEQYDLDGKLVTCDVNTTGHQIYKLNPPRDRIFVKHNFNVFSNPNLVSTLEENMIKTLVVTGFDTCFCVENAMRYGNDLGYKMVLVENLVGMNAKRMDLHNQTINVSKHLGVISSSEEIINIWNSY